MAIFSSSAAITNISNVRTEIKEPPVGREFINYASYQQALGSAAIPLKDWQGDDMYWLRSDREFTNHRWQRAMSLITSNQKLDYLKPFAQINSYYRIVIFWARGKKHQIVWMRGAYYLVKELTRAYYSGVASGIINWFTPNDLLNLLQTLNLAIVDWAVTQFYRLLYGEYANNPLLGQDAWGFDRDFINHEQGPVAFPAYDGATTDARTDINEIFNNQPTKFGLGALDAMLKNLDPTGIFIPVYPSLYNSDLTQNTTDKPNYGQEARIDIPLLMLYPNAYFYNDPQFSTTVLVQTFKSGMAKGKNGMHVVLDKDGNASVEEEFDLTVYLAYLKANSMINQLCDKL